MLCTFDGLEGQVPPRVRDAGFHFWNAAVMVTPVPWYLLSVRRRPGDERLETVFVASESMLVGLLDEFHGEGVVGLLRFDAELGQAGGWRMASVCAVWCDWRLPEGARLSFRLQGESTLRDASLQPVGEKARGWLLAELRPSQE